MPTPNPELLYGPFLIGTFVNMILYGILIMQAYFYYQTYKKDTLWMKLFVLYLFIVETVNTAFDMEMMYEPLVRKLGKPEALIYFPKLFAAEPAVIVAVSTPIQIFFAWRIRLLTQSNLLFFIICGTSIVSAAGGIWTTVKIATIRLFARKPELHWTALVWFLAACIADVMITSILVLNLSRKKTGFTQTDDAITRIIRMTVQTGMLTALFAIGDVVFFMTLPHTALNFIWDLSLSKLYANCLFSTLNARAHLQEIAGYGSNIRGTSDRQRRQADTDHGSHVLSGPMFELAHPSKTYDDDDVEYGITITKVIETRQDPSPTPEDQDDQHRSSLTRTLSPTQ